MSTTLAEIGSIRLSADAGRKMFDELVGVFPDTMTRAALGASTGYASTGGTFRTYLPKLHRLGLVEYRGEEVKASDALFMGAA